MSAQRRSDRKRAANTRLNDLPDSSPTKPKAQPAARKRKAGTHATPVNRRRRQKQQTPEEEDPETEEDGNSDDEAEDEEHTSQELSDLIIPYLDVAAEPVIAQHHHANARGEELYGAKDINAFAKICGRDWTYYVCDPSIMFGRYPEDRQSVGPNGEPDGKMDVQVDLGPSKTVSRNHAVVYFESSDERWHVKVLGRNGVKINDIQLKKGEDRMIQSGDVLGIAGTQMLFQAAEGKAVIHQMFLDRILEHQNPGGREAVLASKQLAIAPERPMQPLPQRHGSAPRQPSPSAYVPLPFPDAEVPIVPTPASFMPRPVTPDMTPNKAGQSSAKKRSPQYKRGIMMESTEHVDYSLDSSKDLKPGCSYATMITWAILDSPEEALSLNGIYDWIKQHYAYYRLVPSGWQNSIRHNLSLNPAFDKIARRSDEPGKGMKWVFVPEKREETIAAARKNASKGGGRTSSTPGSPAGAHIVSGGFPQQGPPPGFNGINGMEGDGPRNGLLASPQRQFHGHPYGGNPPLSPFPPSSQMVDPKITSTPPQASAPHLPIYAPTQGNIPTLSDPTSPIRNRSTNGRLPTSGLDSSPVLNSYGWNPDHHSTSTPAPKAYNLNAPAPMTAKLPTSHMVNSSPAPFWTFPGGYGSTPARAWADMSPVKTNGTVTNNGAGHLLSSSPPPAMGPNTISGMESPTRKGASASRPVSSSMSGAGGRNNASGGNSNSSFPSIMPTANMGPDDDDDDGPIDVTKGFAKIDSFHQERKSMSANMST